MRSRSKWPVRIFHKYSFIFFAPTLGASPTPPELRLRARRDGRRQDGRTSECACAHVHCRFFSPSLCFPRTGSVQCVCCVSLACVCVCVSSTTPTTPHIKFPTQTRASDEAGQQSDDAKVPLLLCAPRKRNDRAAYIGGVSVRVCACACSNASRRRVFQYAAWCAEMQLPANVLLAFFRLCAECKRWWRWHRENIARVRVRGVRFVGRVCESHHV